MTEVPRTAPTQEEALQHLVAAGILSQQQCVAVRAALASVAPKRAGATTWLAEAAGYAGGCLLLAGVALFIGASWESLTRVERSGLLGGFAVAFAVAGLAVAGGPAGIAHLRAVGAPVRCRIVGVLFAVTAVAAGAAVGIACLPTSFPALAGTCFALVVALAGYAVLPSVPGVLATAAASFATVAALAEEIIHVTPLEGGLLILTLGLGWTAVAATGRVSPRWLPFTIGAALSVLGSQQPMGSEEWAPLAYALTFAVAMGSFALYWRYRLLILLLTGVLGVTISVPEAVSDLTGGALGGSVILLAAGGALIAASVFGLRLHRQGDQMAPAPPDQVEPAGPDQEAPAPPEPAETP